jgi:hypothetical protein
VTRSYRPTNGTEGSMFEERFCRRCTHDRPDAPCRILTFALACGLGDPEYPAEWVEDEAGPRCTAFAHAETGAPSAAQLEAEGQLRMFAS